MTAYADSDDMVARYDVRTIGDLLADDGTRVASGAFSANTNMTAALDSATGEVKAAILRAERYTPTQITNMLDVSHADYSAESAAYLVDITCQVAFWNLWRRKPYPDSQQRREAKQDYKDSLELLNSGVHVFEVPSAMDAGTPKVSTVTRSEIESDWDLFVDRARGRYYPGRRSYKQR